MKLSHETGLNAAQIMLRCFEHSSQKNFCNLMGVIARAARKLARIECSNRFIWERQKYDWESVCARIAEFICHYDCAPKKRHIRYVIDHGKFE